MKPVRCGAPPTVRDIDGAEDARRCFGLIAQLRPGVTDERAWLDYWRRQRTSGYRLAALLVDDVPLGLAGYRVSENLVHGRFLYVDDVVTDDRHRGRGHGEQLMDFLRGQAQRLGCRRLVLDTPLSNQLAHRFYFRCGLLASSLRFTEDIVPIGPAEPAS